MHVPLRVKFMYGIFIGIIGIFMNGLTPLFIEALTF